MTFAVIGPIEGAAMAKGRYARLDKDSYNLPARIPMDLYEWLRAYAHEKRISQNAAIVEAVELLRQRETDPAQATEDASPS